MHTVALSSSDGLFNISVAGDDTELIASMLLLLEVPGRVSEHALDQVALRRQQREWNSGTREAPAA
jgi:hypothetical protein